MDTVCRACNSLSVNFKSLWQDIVENEFLGNIMMTCASVQVSKDDGLPNSICAECVQQLLTAFHFKNLCEKTDTILRQVKIPEVKSENLVVENSDCNNTSPLEDELTEEDTISLIFDPIKDESVYLSTSKTPGDADHTCPECMCVFETREDCDLHLVTHIGNVDIFACALCAEEFVEKSAYDRHMRNVHGLHGTHPKVYVCKICNKRYSVLDRVKKHMTVHLKVKPFKCRSCDRGYNSMDNMFNHQKRCKGEQVFICDICNRGFSRVDGLEAHMGNHELNSDVRPMLESLDDIEQYILVETLESNQITEIEEEVPSAVQLSQVEQDYLKDNRGPGRPKKNENSPREVFNYDKETKLYSCRYCQRKFKRVNHLKRHLFSHSEYEPFTCEICAKQFKRADHLTRHQKLHYAEKPYQCEQCPKAFMRKEQVKEHVEARHSSQKFLDKKYRCSICEKSFTTKKYREVHEKAHAIQKKRKDLICKTCLLQFESKLDLLEHEKLNIACAKKYLCSECGQRFVKKNYLMVHIRRHRGEKPYKCRFCEKGFPRSTDVTRHERFHTGEKKHLCIICGKGFSRAYNLTLHMRVHTGEKPYACTYCNAAFAQSNDLKSHIRRHTGERYHCEICGHAFLKGYLLKQHKRVVHGGTNMNESDKVKALLKKNSTNGINDDKT